MAKIELNVTWVLNVTTEHDSEIKHHYDTRSTYQGLTSENRDMQNIEIDIHSQ